MEAGDLLLVDAAANYQGLTGDITRTYPVNGTFTAAQRDIYDIVLAAQQAGEAAAKSAASARDIQKACDEVLRAGLREARARDRCHRASSSRSGATHGVSTGLGWTCTTSRVPAAARRRAWRSSIEPGIYIREAALDDLPKTPENAAFIEKVRPMVQKYQNIGVRIEDSFLLTEPASSGLSAARRGRSPKSSS